MHVNAEGRELIRRHEGLRLKVYLCPAGKPTVGYGHRTTLPVGAAITRNDADNLFNEDLAAAESGVVAGTLRGPALNENQFSALVSFVFNVGAQAFAESRLAHYLCASDFDAAAAEWGRWNHVAGQVNDGLTARRAEELALFMRPVEATP